MKSLLADFNGNEYEKKQTDADLNVFSLCFVIQNVCNITSKDLLSASTCMYTNHRHSNWPRCIADCHFKVRIVCLQNQTFIQHQLLTFFQ